MKKILTFMLMMIGMVLMSTFTTSCSGHHRHYTTDADSVYVAEIVNSINSATFTSDKDFMFYLINKRDEARADSIVFRLHDAVVNGICNKILANGGVLSIRTVCDEYLNNQQFYDGMNKSLERPSASINEYNAFEPGDSTKEGGTN